MVEPDVVYLGAARVDQLADERYVDDLEDGVVDVYRLGDDGHYGAPSTLGRDESLTCLAAPGFELAVDEVVGA